MLFFRICLNLTLTALLALATSADVKAGFRTIDDLLQSPTRPTIADVVSVTGLPPSQIEIPAAGQYPLLDLAKTQLKLVAHDIAMMEYLFPGAVWAPLGRDAVIFGDALDAFYTFHNQPGRVARLNGSGDSIRGQDPTSLIRFLKDAGMDLNHSARPFVGLDRTSYGANSQSRTLLNAAYEEYVKQNGNSKSLPPRLNFIGLGQREQVPGFGLETFFSQNYESERVTNIVQLNVGNWTDSLAWHHTFGKLEIQPNGKYEGTPGAISPLEDRKFILGEQAYILKEIASSQFTALVVKEARRLGYDFVKQLKTDPVELRRQIEWRAAKQTEEIREKYAQSITEIKQNEIRRLKKIFFNWFGPTESRVLFYAGDTWLWSVTGKKSKYVHSRFDVKWMMNRNLFKLRDLLIQLKLLKTNFFTINFLSEATHAYKKERLKLPEYRDAIALAIELSDIDDEFLMDFRSLCVELPEFKKVFIAESVYFASEIFSENRHDIKQAYLELREKIGEPLNAHIFKSEVNKLAQINLDNIIYDSTREILNLRLLQPHSELLNGDRFESPFLTPNTLNSVYMYVDETRLSVSAALQKFVGEDSVQKVEHFETRLIREFTRAYERRSLSRYAFRDLLSILLAKAPLDNKFVENMRKACESAALRKLLLEEEVFFAGGLSEMSQGIAAYRLIRTEVLGAPLDEVELNKVESAKMSKFLTHILETSYKSKKAILSGTDHIPINNIRNWAKVRSQLLYRLSQTSERSNKSNFEMLETGRTLLLHKTLELIRLSALIKKDEQHSRRLAWLLYQILEPHSRNINDNVISPVRSSPVLSELLWSSEIDIYAEIDSFRKHVPRPSVGCEFVFFNE